MQNMTDVRNLGAEKSAEINLLTYNRKKNKLQY